MAVWQNLYHSVICSVKQYTTQQFDVFVGTFDWRSVASISNLNNKAIKMMKKLHVYNVTYRYFTEGFRTTVTQWKHALRSDSASARSSGRRRILGCGRFNAEDFGMQMEKNKYRSLNIIWI